MLKAQEGSPPGGRVWLAQRLGQAGGVGEDYCRRMSLGRRGGGLKEREGVSKTGRRRRRDIGRDLSPGHVQPGVQGAQGWCQDPPEAPWG